MSRRDMEIDRAILLSAVAIGVINLAVLALVMSDSRREGFANQPGTADTVDAIPYDVLTIDNVLTSEECDRLVAHARAAPLNSSKVWTGNASQPDTQSDYRTSQQTWVDYADADVGDIARKLRKKAAQLSGVFDPASFEKVQLAKYGPQGQYRQHFDSCTSNCPDNRLCRVATLLVYLNDANGGATVFPKMGISIQPKKGSASYFYNVDTRDPEYPELQASLHAGSPVNEGEKFIANVWVTCPRSSN